MSKIEHPHVNQVLGALQIADIQKIADFDVSENWTVLNDDTTNLGNSNNHATGKLSLEFDKVNGSSNGKIAMVHSTIAELDIRRFGPESRLFALVHISDMTNVKDAFIRLGTDSSNYNQWTFPDTSLTNSIWSPLDKKIHESAVVVAGTGLNFAALKWVAVGVTFDAEADNLLDLQYDSLLLRMN